MFRAALLVVTVAVAQASAVIANDQPVKRLDMAKVLVDQMAAGQFDKAVEPFDKTMRHALPADKLKKVWDGLTKQHGKFERAKKTRTEKIEQHEAIYVTCEFERGNLDTKVVFTSENKVTGLFFVPSRKANPIAARYILPLFATGTGMMLVAVIAIVLWWRIARTPLRWYWVGVGLWTIAVALKILDATLISGRVLIYLKTLPHPLDFALGGLYCGVQSSIFEMGLTLLAVLVWRQLGRDGGRAITIGVGAGALEAFLLGLVPLAAGIFLLLSGGAIAETIVADVQKTASLTPVYWLTGPVERIIAVLCHASSRALILLGVSKRRYLLAFWGFLLFTLLDGVAGGLLVAGVIGKVSTWWVELAILPCAVISVLVLTWCYRRWPEERIATEVFAETSTSEATEACPGGRLRPGLYDDP